MLNLRAQASGLPSSRATWAGQTPSWSPHVTCASQKREISGECAEAKDKSAWGW